MTQPHPSNGDADAGRNGESKGQGPALGEDDPIDTEFEAVETSNAAPQPAAGDPPAGLTMQAGVALAIAAAIVGGLIGIVFDSPPEPAPQENTELAAELATLQSALNDLSSEVEGAEATASRAAIDARADVETLRGDFTDLRSDLVALQEAVDAASTRGTDPQIEQALAEIEDLARSAVARADEALAREPLTTDDLAPLERALADLSGAVDSQGARLDRLDDASFELAARVTEQPDAPAGADAAALLAYSRLSLAARSGGAFAGVLNDVASDLPASPALTALGPLADSGAPSRAELAEQLDDVAREARRAERGSGGNLFDRLGRSLTTAIVVGRPGAENSVAAADITARAQTHLENDDLESGVDEMERLSGPALDTARAWIDNAQTRLAIEAELRALNTTLSALNVDGEAGAGPSAPAQDG